MTLNTQEDSEISRSSFELISKEDFNEKSWFMYLMYVMYLILYLFFFTFYALAPGSERLVVSCPSRDERLRLVELLQKQIRNPVIASQAATSIPSVSRPPFRLMTRYMARLIKTGLLTHQRLREILDGGKSEHQRRVLLGCTIINPSLSAEMNDLNRFRRQCKVECLLSADDSQTSSLHSRSIHIEKELTLGIPLGARYWNRSSTSSTSSSSSSGLTNEKFHWPAQTRTREGFGGSVDRTSSPAKSPRFPSRSQSLPPLDFRIVSSVKAPTAEQTNCPVQRPYTSTTVGAWVSNFSYDSGLADVGGATPSQSRDATGTSSDISISSSVSHPVYRSTLYAHWWRKAKLSSEVVLARPSSPPFPSSTGKGMELSR